MILYNKMLGQPSINDDFYGHINYEWLKANPIPEEYTKWGNFHVLNERNQYRLKEILEETSNNVEGDKLSILWNQGLDDNKLNNINPRQVFKFFENFETMSIMEMIISFMKFNLCYLFDMESYNDKKDSKRNILYFDRMSLSLPDRDYYLIDKMSDKREQYKEFLSKFLEHFGIESKVNDVYDFEENVAKIILSKELRRDPKKTYNLYTYDELKESYKGIEWDKLFQEFKLPTDDKIVITEPEYFKFLSDYLIKCNNDKDEFNKLKNFYKYRFAKSVTSYIDDKSYEIYFDFFARKLTGQQEAKVRWKRVLGTVDGILGEVLSKEYVSKYFKEEQKESCKKMIKEIVKTYEERIRNLEWMSEKTKEKALVKLAMITIKIGYPDKWTDFSDLEILKERQYYENVLYSSKWALEDNLKKLYKAVDPNEWHMNAHDINAYYNPPMNEIVFPAGILQEPFYSISQTLAENLGGIGAVIGHEITHGFDDKGRLYDSDGNLNDWWTEYDSKNFEERSKKLEEQFNGYEYFGINVKGKLTLGENIADLGGLTLSLKTLERLEKNVDKKGLFEQWAKIWRCNIRDDMLKNQLLTDPHSPTMLRVNGILPNFEEFYEIYKITENDKMYIKPELRSKIW